MPTRRTLLPLLDATAIRHGSRSRMTCHYRCGDACDQPVPNPTQHPTMHELVETAIARRSVLRAGALGAGALVAGPALAPAAAAAQPLPRMADLSATGFTPVAPNNRDSVTVPGGFGHHVVISWGDPVVPGAPRFDPQNQSPEAQARQFGYNNDYIGVLPLSRTRALLVCNHEYTNENIMFPTGTDPDLVRRVAMMAHGMSVVEIRRDSPDSGAWRRVRPGRASYNRRVTVATPMRLTGPAAGHPRLVTSADPRGRRVLGTLNNCAGGLTPWGTVLSGEENFNQYFEASGATAPEYAASYARYGISSSNVGRGWRNVDQRFDLTAEPHEPFRFGWIVELDPRRPGSMPRKRTMLGRFKHEGANIAVDRSGRVAAYMGDDERGDYLYKFVSRDPMRTGDGEAARRHNDTLLDHGTLFVARLTGDGESDGRYDGTGEWLPLCTDTESFVESMSVAEVLIDTRLAADTLAPTRMDRPEDVEPNPLTGKVYAALTNNSQRGSTFPRDEANPVTTSQVRASLGAPLTPASGNRHGYILELTERGGRHTARRFTWSLLLVCGDPEDPQTYFAGFDKSKVSPISCPDNVAFDRQGNLWIATDGNALGSNDGLFRVPLAGPRRGQVQQFLTMPVGAETCGPFLTEDNRSVFVGVQHPGEVDGATFEAQASTWPHVDGVPRPSVVVTYRP